MHNPAISQVPVAVTRVSPLIGLPFGDTTLYKVGYPGLDFLPGFPYTHTDSATKPSVGL